MPDSNSQSTNSANASPSFLITRAPHFYGRRLGRLTITISSFRRHKI